MLDSRCEFVFFYFHNITNDEPNIRYTSLLTKRVTFKPAYLIFLCIKTVRVFLSSTCIFYINYESIRVCRRTIIVFSLWPTQFATLNLRLAETTLCLLLLLILQWIIHLLSIFKLRTIPVSLSWILRRFTMI